MADDDKVKVKEYPKVMDHPTEKTTDKRGKEIPVRVTVNSKDEEKALGNKKADPFAKKD